MTIRVSDSTMLKELLAAHETVSLEGPAGEPLGTFTPTTDPLELEAGISRAEMERRLKNPSRGYTTEQVLAHLRSL